MNDIRQCPAATARNAWLRSALLGLALCFGLNACITPPESAGPPAGTVHVKLIAFNDFHGYLEAPGTRLAAPDPARPGHTVAVATGGAAELATLVNQLRAQNPEHLVVGAGDMVGASPLISGLFLDEPAIEVLNTIGLDITSVGNHEFDRGVAELMRKQNGGCERAASIEGCQMGRRFEGAHFHYLAANVVDRHSGRPILAPYEIRRFQGQPVAFIGVTLKGTGRIVSPTGVEGVEFLDEATTVNGWVATLRAQGVHSFVLLIHQGAEATGDIQGGGCEHFEGELLPILDRLDPDVSVVVSGHTHQAYICTYHGILVTSAASFSRLVTDIDIEIDRSTDRIVAKTARNLVVAGPNDPDSPAARAYPALAPDPAVAAQVRRYALLARPLAERPVGQIEATLTRAAGEGVQSSFGSVIADAQWQATAGVAKAQLAFTNPGGIRTDLVYKDAGAVTYGAVFAAQPFGNSLVTMTLTGEQLKAVLEQQWSAHPDRPLFLQVSRTFHYAFDASRPVGDRVLRSSMRLDGQAIEPGGSYRVTVNSFLAAGGDGFSALTLGTDTTVGGLDADALESYIAGHSPLPVPRDRRVEAVSSR